MNNLNKLRFNNVKYAYGMLHNCDMFLFDIDDGKTWPRVLRNAKAYENSTTPPDCDCSSVDFAFDYSPETGEVSAIRIVHFHSGFAEVLNIVELPIYHRVGLQQRVLPRRTFDNFEKAAYTIHENILGFTCQYLSDVIVGAMFLETDDLLTECMMNIRSVNYTPIVMGYIQEDSVFSRSFNAVRNPTFWKKVENYFKKFYLEYWHLFWLLCTCAVLLTAPLLILCGRLYHQMIVSAARFNIALDALIATNCDVLEHIRERQKLLSDSGFESISLNDVNVEDDQLRVKAEMLYRMQFGKQSPTAIEHQQSSTQTSTQVTKN
ncbi:hypothetical protein M3Y98_00576400 [Aphelenchoides besseyi]|nr:hypothetical protein M3Y98_00576400 [Aphelenchoides besseyi]KAI6193841.1 hypothetical protein M3Y96_01061600 [Aphelenchoides besseyi]